MKHNCTEDGISFTHTHILQTVGNSQQTAVDFMNKFPDTFQTVTDRSLFGPNVPHGVNTLTRWLTNSGCVAQALSSLNHSSTVRQTIMSAMSSNYNQTWVSLKLRIHCSIARLCQSMGILAVDEAPPDEWEAEEDVKGEPLDPREVKSARDKEMKYLWDMEVYEYSTEAEAPARTGRNPVGLQVDRYQKRKRRSPTLTFVSGVYRGAP